MEQKYQCKYCGTCFHKESTLSTHMCVKKRRHMDIGSTGSRLGLMAFNRFFELTTRSKKPKTAEDFINSSYYTDFARFGNYLAGLKPAHLDKFIDYVIMNGVKLKDWTREEIYWLFVDDFIKKEPAVSAVERTIIEIASWCEENKIEFTDFFKVVTANEAAYLIQSGKISPWVLYLSASGESLLDKFNEDHAGMIGSVIDPGFWMRKFKKESEEVDYIRGLLRDAGL